MGYFKTGRRIYAKPRFWEKHHFFWGAIIIISTFFGIFYFPKMMFLCVTFIGKVMFWTWLGLTLFGYWNLIDDTIQHFVQVKEYYTFGFYEKYSFLHWFPYKVLEWLREIAQKR